MQCESKIVKQLSEKQKQLSNEENVDPINIFYCGLHPLLIDTLSKALDKILNSWEKENGVTSSEIFNNRGNYHMYSLINTVSKVFHKDGAGVPGNIKAFLKSKKVQNCFLYFVGERFNLLFHNGGAVYYVSEYVLEFLNKVWGTPNRLLAAIVSDLKKKELLYRMQSFRPNRQANY